MCAAGTSSPAFSSVPCDLCPVGSFKSEASNEACDKCPASTTTISAGAITVQECRTCVPGVCLHGSCFVAHDFSTSCSCNFGYQGPRCGTNVAAIAFASIALGAAVLALATVLFRRYKKRANVLAVGVNHLSMTDMNRLAMSSRSSFCQKQRHSSSCSTVSGAFPPRKFA